MMLELLKEMREIVAVVVPLSIGLLILIAKMTKSSKLRKVAENFIQIENVVKDYMCNAETFLHYNGNDKKEWVKTKVNQFCIENDIQFKDDVVDNVIEQLISLTKFVNPREKDKGKLL